MSDFLGCNRSVENRKPNYRLRLKRAPFHEIVHVKGWTLGVPSEYNQDGYLIISLDHSPVLKAAFDSRINIELASNEGNVFL